MIILILQFITQQHIKARARYAIKNANLKMTNVGFWEGGVRKYF